MLTRSRIRTVLPAACLVLALVSVTSRVLSAADKVPAADAEHKDRPTVRILSWVQTEEFIRREFGGKVVLVNIWTRTCPACVEGFPEFAGLQERFGRDKFACVSVNCDYDGIEGKPPEYYQAGVEMFLGGQKARFDHVLLNTSLLDFLDEVKLNSTPAMFVYDPAGKLVQRFDNDEAEQESEEFKIRDVATALERLLKSNTDPRTARD